ncbi:MAG: zinc metalloprotease HtpX [Cyanobacteria bacterium P01_F01_bin.116]
MGLDQSPEQLLRAGLAALKQKEYGRAITTFQQLNQSDNATSSQRIKAQMGLIQTYAAQGAYDQARILCKPLLKSRSQAIRQWTHDKLQQIGSSVPQPSGKTTDTTTGFIPGTSGFVPFDSANDSPPPVVTESTNSSPVQPKSEPLQQSSLFHYQRLNNPQESVPQTPDSESTNNSVSHDHTILDSHSASANQLEDHSAEKQIQPALIQQSSTPEPSTLELIPGPETWPPGSRLNTVKSLGTVSVGRLWLAQLITLPLLFFVVRWLVQTTLSFVRGYINQIDRLLPLSIRPPSFFGGPYTWFVIAGLSLLTLLSPWLWSWLLGPTKDLTPQQLKSYSPEASQLLQRFCTKRRWSMPKIQVIASDLPLVFSYGWHPRCGVLVISQGLFDCLAADELATLLIYEISHWSKLDWIFFSTHGLLMQWLHRIYWGLAQWGENRLPVVTATAGALASLSYGIFTLLYWVGCGLARTRIPYRDRATAELTGNPNGLIRALAKLSAAMTAAIEQQGYTPLLLESLDLMLPVGPGDITPSIQHLAWGAFNPLRHWLSLNQGHPPLGDRLYILNAYGRHWGLKPSLNFAQLQLKHGSRTLSSDGWKTLLMQGGTWSGLLIGLATALVMWLVGAIATSLDIPLLAWLYKDRSILLSMPLIAAATGQLIRINSFFPEISRAMLPNETQLATWNNDPKLLPLSSLPIKLTGTLTGRPALANWLGQEWRLHTTHGSIKLHYTHYLGPVSNSLAPWLNQPLQVTGWFRRGHNIWIDIDRLRTPQNQIKLAQHPIWAAITSFLLLMYGLWLIFKGG